MSVPAPDGARSFVRFETPGILALAIFGCLGIFVYLAPLGSWPVGFDVWWNLHIARMFAESGIPAAVPEAGFTQLARSFADRQLGFHGLLALIGGARLGPAAVPPFVWGLATLQVVVVFFCARLANRRVSALWLFLLPALSSTWLFRLTALRDMALAVLPLLALLTLLGLPDPAGRRRKFAIAGLAAFFGYVHGAFALPLGLGLVVRVGHRLAGGALRLGALVPVLAGLTVALVVRPDFPANLELLCTLNVRMPLGVFSGALQITPTEFAAPGLGLLLRSSLPALIAAGVLVGLALCRRAAWPFVLPAVAVSVGAVFGSRLFELAVPLLVIALAASAGSRRPWIEALVAVALLFHMLPTARQSVRANRFPELAQVGDWLRDRARPGDVVFVTGWGMTSPLAWATRGLQLRFTGVTDPSLMWAESPTDFDAWWRIKSAQDPDPIGTLRRHFRARFVVFVAGDAAPGHPAGETQRYLLAAIDRFHGVAGRIAGPWYACQLVD